jgi:tRNA threonylcarbamoyl adenosine modification protein (Sua5/YciO/YrdC/YwlC family)
MVTEFVKIHHITPEQNKIRKIVQKIKDGALVLYPSDTGFALGCKLENKDAITRIRQIRSLSEKNYLTFVCGSLSNIAEYANVSTMAYKTIKSLIPGPYTFVLPASKLVPKFAQNPKRKSSGIRIPEGIFIPELIKELGEPLISISAVSSDDFSLADEIIEKISPRVDLVVEMQEYDFSGESTVIDMLGDDFEIIREGAGFEKARDLIH